MRMLEVCGMNGQHMVSIILPRAYHQNHKLKAALINLL
jgi:hypothetical protein